MISGVYILVPIFRKIIKYDESKNILLYFIAIFFTFGILKSTILLIHFRNVEIIKNIDYINDIANIVDINLALKYCGYFILGYHLMNTKYDKKIINIFLILGILGVISCVITTSIYSLHVGKPVSIAYDHFSISTFVESVALFLFF